MKKRLLVVGDSLATPTGFAYISGMFTKYFLQSGLYDVAYCSLTGAPCNSYDQIRSVDTTDKVFENEKLKLFSVDYYSSLIPDFRKVIETFSPEIVVTIHDPWILEIMAFTEYTSSFLWVAYTTIETPKYGDKIYEKSITGQNYKSISMILNRASLTIPVTNMAKKALLDLGVKNVYDSNIFNGLEFEKECKTPLKKSQLFGGICKDDDFVFMTMGVNSERKKHERTILAFSKFLKRVRNPEKYFLYMHTNIYSSLGGPDLSEIIDSEGINANIIALGDNSFVSKERVYQLYAGCDCYIALPGGEGFSLGYAEAMLHKKPTIYIDYGGHAEYAVNGGLKVKVSDYVYAMRLGMKWGLADIDDAVSQMLNISNDSSLRKKLGEKGYSYVVDNFDWNKLSKDMIEAIESTYKKRKDNKLFGMKTRRIV
jgi:glycosyltransferase involved in cell wall biosynthesis